LDIFQQRLQPANYQSPSGEYAISSVFRPKQRHGFLYFDNGPAIPETIAIISGGAAKQYRSEQLLAKHIDTFICGNVEETTPAVSYETKTNFVNIGHYWSEKAGLLALQAEIQQRFAVETVFIEIENVV
jgi:putative NIF3 family GTP cyclohydrolase 1 type 2